ncbi:TetR/AcrR family transcriptional regulator [Gracilibacillus massiliensis]|uniref:TetR/AcrR family transcriptional regulator n=1 Tax=Gracilibacillus massiliensis TaxID=1564956 RepID=UPI00071E5B7A|nr:TetR/AcrR family transcriptional regulator [Gracilibacillus massiliensis]
MKKMDPRVKKTRKFLEEALIDLIEVKGFEAITVGNLAEKAEINRVTFYQHYHDKYELLEQTIETMLRDFIEAVAPNKREELVTDKDETNNVYLQLFQFVYEHQSFFKTMLGENGVTLFHNRMTTSIQQFVSDTLAQLAPNESNAKVPREIVVHYVAAASIGLIKYWVQTGMTYSPHYMAKQLTFLERNGPINAI